MVFARRRNGGRRSTDSASASFWLPSALKVVPRFETTPRRLPRRSASAVTSADESTRNRRSSRSSRVSSPKRRAPVESAGFR